MPARMHRQRVNLPVTHVPKVSTAPSTPQILSAVQWAITVQPVTGTVLLTRALLVHLTTSLRDIKYLTVSTVWQGKLFIQYNTIQCNTIQMLFFHSKHTHIQCGDKQKTREINGQITIYIILIEVKGEKPNMLYMLNQTVPSMYLQNKERQK